MRLPSINPVSIGSAAASQPDFIVAGATVLRSGEKIFLSVEKKDYAKAEDAKRISWGPKSDTGWVKEPYDCVIDYFATVTSSAPYRSEVIKGLLAWRPLIDVFSNGDLLVVSRPPINPGPDYESTPNASVFKDGIKYDELNVGHFPEQMSIDEKDRIWITINEDLLVSDQRIKPRGEPEAISLVHLSPMCLKRNGELAWDMMPWTKMEGNSSDYSFINVSDQGTWVMTDSGSIGLGRVDAKGEVEKMKANFPKSPVYGFAVLSDYLMSFHYNDTTSISRLGQPIDKYPKVFALNCTKSRNNTIQQFIFQEDKIHIRTEKYWEVYSVSDAMRQLEQWDA